LGLSIIESVLSTQFSTVGVFSEPQIPELQLICRPDISSARRAPYRNPLIFARELHYEMLLGNLTRVQLGQRHGITSDRITQWLCLLKLPEEKQQEIEVLGDYWGRRLVMERWLRTSMIQQGLSRV